jgi:hypothetical protein
MSIKESMGSFVTSLLNINGPLTVARVVLQHL